MRNLVFLMVSLMIGWTASLSAAILNFGSIDTGIYRGGHLGGGEADFRELRDMGVQAIINLDALHFDNTALCAEFSMDCQRIPLALIPFYDRNFDYQKLTAAYREVLRSVDNERNVYIHCYHGSDRTGALAAALKVRKRVCGRSDYKPQELKDELVAELEKYHFHRPWFPSLFRTILSWAEQTPAWICETPALVPAPPT